MFTFSVILLAIFGAAFGIDCPVDGQFFYSHPFKCCKFIECNHGIEVEVDCFQDLVFNPNVGYCDFPSNYPCEDKVEEGPVGECPALNGEFVDFLTDATRCDIFYMCNWGTPIRMECPDDLHFNPELNVCDWPYRAGCTAEESKKLEVNLAAV